MDDRRIAREGLDEIRLDRVSDEHRHGAGDLEIAYGDGIAADIIGDDDPGDAGFEIREVFGKTKNRHDLGGDGNVEAVVARRFLRGG